MSAGRVFTVSEQTIEPTEAPESQRHYRFNIAALPWRHFSPFGRMGPLALVAPVVAFCKLFRLRFCFGAKCPRHVTLTAPDPAMLPKRGFGQWIRADDQDVQRSLSWWAIQTAEPQPAPPPEELYDLAADPDEQTNLVDAPEAREALAEMRVRMDRMMQRTNSPLQYTHVSPSLSRTPSGY